MRRLRGREHVECRQGCFSCRAAPGGEPWRRSSDARLDSQPYVVTVRAGSLTVHAYALCILTGVFVAIGMGRRRWVARGGAGGRCGRFRLGQGRAFVTYVAAYTVGRGGIELLRVDHANHVLGMRVNTWMPILVCAAALGYLWCIRRRPREDPADLRGPGSTALPGQGSRAELPATKVESRMTSSGERGGG